MAKESIHDLVQELEHEVELLGKLVMRSEWEYLYVHAKQACSAAAKLMQRADVLRDSSISAYAQAAVDRALKRADAAQDS